MNAIDREAMIEAALGLNLTPRARVECEVVQSCPSVNRSSPLYQMCDTVTLTGQEGVWTVASVQGYSEPAYGLVKGSKSGPVYQEWRKTRRVVAEVTVAQDDIAGIVQKGWP